MITIDSSWGVVTTEDDGTVVGLQLDDVSEQDCYLLHIDKFDVAGWDTRYEAKHNQPSPKPSEFDILELGYRNKDGKYIEPTWTNI